MNCSLGLLYVKQKKTAWEKAIKLEMSPLEGHHQMQMLFAKG